MTSRFVITTSIAILCVAAIPFSMTCGQDFPDKQHDVSPSASFYDPQVVQEIRLEIAPQHRKKMLDALPKTVYVPATFRWGKLNDSAAILDDSLEGQMAERLPWVLPTDPARDVLDSMEEFNIRFLAVLDPDHRVIGLTGQKTLVEFIAEAFPHEVLTQDPTGQTVSQSKEGA